jgi:hypothetical protein
MIFRKVTLAELHDIFQDQKKNKWGEGEKNYKEKQSYFGNVIKNGDKFFWVWLVPNTKSRDSLKLEVFTPNEFKQISHEFKLVENEDVEIWDGFNPKFVSNDVIENSKKIIPLPVHVEPEVIQKERRHRRTKEEVWAEKVEKRNTKKERQEQKEKTKLEKKVRKQRSDKGVGRKGKDKAKVKPVEIIKKTRKPRADKGQKRGKRK